jgi:3-phenylpropionate/trans-cinnamate dioxygenase ferredoxin component
MFVRVAEAAALQVGQSRCFEIDGEKILLVRSCLGYHAIELYCGHASLPLTGGPVEGSVIACPFHGARFDLETGASKGPPAHKSVRVYPLRIRDGQIEVALI